MLGTERISKLLTQYAIPAIIAMTASSLYNMADSIFIGHGVGPLAISGLALTFPLMNLAAAFGSLVGVGASTLVSVKLGQKDYEGANKVLGNVLVLNVVLGLAFTLVFMLLLDPILYFFGASENTISYARDYMNVILIGNVITHMYLGLNAVLRSSGFPKLAMYATLASVVINCVLNPLFIFGFGWGIKGSAWATVISQVISLTGQLIHFSRPKELLHFKKGIYRLKSEIVKGILYIGMSPFLMNLCACLIVILINRGLKEHGGDMAIGAYGIVNRVVFLFIMIIMGFNQGMQPIAGYNFGAREMKRVKKIFRLTLESSCVIMLFGTVICLLASGQLMGLFTTTPETIAAGSRALKIISAGFLVSAVSVTTSGAMEGLGKGTQSLVISLFRYVVVIMPTAYLLSHFMGPDGVWNAFWITEVFTAIVSVMIYHKTLKKA